MSKKAIIGTLLSFILVTGGIVYTISNSLQHNKKRADIINNEKVIIDTAKAPNELKDGEYQASAEGYEGPITVKVIIKDGKIFSVDVISQNETPEYYELAKKILQSIVEKNTFNVDSISGATVTADAIKIAVYKALLQAGAKSSDVAINLEKDNKELREKEKSKISEKLSNIVAGTVSLTNEKLKDGTFIGTGFGYNGPIRVSVTVRNGVIVAVNVISHNEDYPYFGWALRVLSNILSGNKNVDTVSGATVSSRGILNAINNALLQAGAEKKQFEVKQISKTDENIKQNKSSETDIEQIKKGFKNLVDGVYIGSSSGYYDNSIQVKVTVQNGKISKIELMKNNDDPQYFDSDKAKILEQRIVNKQSTDIDTVTNATVSSKGYINAVVKALEKAVNQNGTQADKYIYPPKKIIIIVGNTIDNTNIINSLENLPNGTDIKILEKTETNIPKETTISVQLKFKDGSTKIVKIPVIVKEKSELGTFKFLNNGEIKKLDEKKYKDGIYYGDGSGFVSAKPIPVKIEIKDGKIVNIEIVHDELKKVKEVAHFGQIDDGGKFQEKVYTVFSMVKNSAKANSINYKFRILLDAVNEITKELNNKQITLENYKNALIKVLGKSEFGHKKATITQSDINQGKSELRKHIFELVKIFIKEDLAYDVPEYDSVTGATFTASGTAMAIDNALKKASPDIDFYDLRIIDDNLKTKYKVGEKLDISNLKVVLYKKNALNQNKIKEVIDYDKFKSKGLKVIDDYGKEIPNGMILDEKHLRNDITTGIRLRISHEKSATLKFVRSITIQEEKEFTVKSIKLKSKDSDKWEEIKIINNQDFIQKLFVSKELAEKFSGKDLEFKLVVENMSGQIKEVNLTSSGTQDMKGVFDGSKDYSLQVDKQFKGKLNFDYYRIYLKAIGFENMSTKYNEPTTQMFVKPGLDITQSDLEEFLVDLPEDTKIEIINKINPYETSKEQYLIVNLKFSDKSEKTIKIRVIVKNNITLADKYNSTVKEIIVSKEKGITDNLLLSAFPNLPQNTKIVKKSEIDISKVDNKTTIDVTLKFNDNSEKEFKVKLIVKSEKSLTKVEKFKIQNPLIENNVINVILDEQKYGEKLKDTTIYGGFRSEIIKRDLNLNLNDDISHIEILKQPDRSKLGISKGKASIHFKNESEPLILTLKVKVNPYPVNTIYKVTSTKTSYKLNEQIDFSKINATLFVYNALENGKWTGKTPVTNIPYQDFELFGLKVVNSDTKSEIEEYTTVTNELVTENKLNIGVIFNSESPVTKIENITINGELKDEELEEPEEISDDENSENEIYEDDENGDDEYDDEVKDKEHKEKISENKDKNKNAVQNESAKNEQGSVNKKQDLDKNKQKNSEKPIEKPSDKNSISDKVLTDKAPKFNKESKETIK